MSSNSSFRRILHNSFSFTGPYIFRRIFISIIYTLINTLACVIQYLYRDYDFSGSDGNFLGFYDE
jgi:hypothetical protein